MLVFWKGGTGIVDKNVCIIVKSASKDKNKLIVRPTEETEEEWKGKNANQAEVAIVQGGKIWWSETLPH